MYSEYAAVIVLQIFIQIFSVLFGKSDSSAADQKKLQDVFGCVMIPKTFNFHYLDFLTLELNGFCNCSWKFFFFKLKTNGN